MKKICPKAAIVVPTVTI